MNKIVTLNTTESPYKLGDFISYTGKVYVVQEIEHNTTMGTQIGTSVKIAPIAIKEFKSSEVILVTDSVN